MPGTRERDRAVPCGGFPLHTCSANRSASVTRPPRQARQAAPAPGRRSRPAKRLGSPTPRVSARACTARSVFSTDRQPVLAYLYVGEGQPFPRRSPRAASHRAPWSPIPGGIHPEACCHGWSHEWSQNAGYRRVPRASKGAATATQSVRAAGERAWRLSGGMRARGFQIPPPPLPAGGICAGEAPAAMPPDLLLRPIWSRCGHRPLLHEEVDAVDHDLSAASTGCRTRRARPRSAARPRR